MWGFGRATHDNDTATLAAISRSQAIIEFTPSGAILKANENFLSLMGYALSEIEGQQHRLFVDPAYASSDEYREFWQRLRAGEPQVAEFRRLAKGGREVWVEASYSPVVDADGKVIRIVKVATDITDKKHAVADWQGQVSAINTSQAVIEFTPDGAIVAANDKFLGAMGYRLDEIVGRHHRMFVAADYAGSPDYRDFWARLGPGRVSGSGVSPAGEGRS